jgi:tyrosyl-tRNA synthetase
MIWGLVMALFEELSWRGLVHQATAENIADVLRAPLTMYTGFDPSAPSLHVGSLMPITGMQHFRRHGHQVIALVGGATGMIGDPSGKTSERKLLTADEVVENSRRLTAQIQQLFADEPGPPVRIVDNLDWFRSMSVLEFLRDTGKHFTVNQMIHRDSVRSRFEGREAGISFTEFSYMLLQAHDFLELWRRHGCSLQCGASDQWGNIVSGVDLIRRTTGETAHGLTMPLVTDAEGRKYGKTEKGAVYLDPKLTSAYAFYQFWLNTADADTGRFLRWLTFLEREEIEALEGALGSGERRAQRALAEALTRRVHGAAELERVVDASESLFGGDIRAIDADLLDEALAAAPSLTVGADRFAGAGALLVDLLAEVGACASKSDARRQLASHGVSVNGTPAPVDADARVSAGDLIAGRLLVLRRGKRNNFVIRVGG